jgi:hypothetical protein
VTTGGKKDAPLLPRSYVLIMVLAKDVIKSYREPQVFYWGNEQINSERLHCVPTAGTVQQDIGVQHQLPLNSRRYQVNILIAIQRHQHAP